MLKGFLITILSALLFASCLQLDEDVVKEPQISEEPEWLFITKEDGLAEDIVTTMLKDSKGFYWFGHLTMGITRWDGKDEYFTFPPDFGLTSNYVFRIVEAPDGRIWIATSKGYDIVDGSTIVESYYYNFAFTDIIFPEPETVWLSSQTGIYVFSNAGDSVIYDNSCTFCGRTMKLLVDSENNIWASSLEDIRRYNAAAGYRVDKQYYIGSREGFLFPTVAEIFEDETNTIFGGSHSAESNTFNLSGGEPQFLDLNAASSVGVSAITTYNNQLWIGTRGVGVIKTNGTSISLFLDELPNPQVNDLMNDGRSIWIATNGGVAKYTAR